MIAETKGLVWVQPKHRKQANLLACFDRTGVRAGVCTAGGMFMTAPTPNALCLSRPHVHEESVSPPQTLSPPPTLEDSTALTASCPPASDASTRLKLSCGGIIPATLDLQASLNIMNRYVPHAPTSDYTLNQLGNTLNYNLFSVRCTKVGVIREHKSRNGARCNKCQQRWTKRSSN